MKCHHSIDDSHVSQTPHLINPSLYLRTTTTTTRPSTVSRFARHSASFFRNSLHSNCPYENMKKRLTNTKAPRWARNKTT